MTIRHAIGTRLVVYRKSMCASATKDFKCAVSTKRTSLMLDENVSRNRLDSRHNAASWARYARFQRDIGIAEVNS